MIIWLLCCDCEVTSCQYKAEVYLHYDEFLLELICLITCRESNCALKKNIFSSTPPFKRKQNNAPDVHSQDCRRVPLFVCMLFLIFICGVVPQSTSTIFLVKTLLQNSSILLVQNNCFFLQIVNLLVK